MIHTMGNFLDQHVKYQAFLPQMPPFPLQFVYAMLIKRIQNRKTELATIKVKSEIRNTSYFSIFRLINREEEKRRKARITKAAAK